MNQIPFRPATQAALFVGLLAVATASGQVPTCQIAKDKEQELHFNRDNDLGNKADDLQRQVERRRAACPGSGSPRKVCLDQVTLFDESATRELRKQLADSEALHDKAMIDIEHSAACSPYTAPTRTACDRARAMEYHRYNTNIAALEKRRIDDRNQHEHELLDCGIGDRPCQRQVEESQEQRLRQEEAEIAAENDRHHRALRDIDNGACDFNAPRPGDISREPTREPPDFVSADPPVSSHEQPVFVTAETAASRLKRLDSEIARHLKWEAGIVSLMRTELQRHLQVFQRPGLSAEAVRRENELHAEFVRDDQKLLANEHGRFDATMSQLIGK